MHYHDAPLSLCLFDTIAEDHVTMSLGEAFEELGCEVDSTGPVWQGHQVPTNPADIDRIRAELHSRLDRSADVLMVIRAASLPPKLVREARDRGVTTAVWLPDDPVLYNILYRHIVDEYDIVFHCGGKTILDFYQEQGHQPGLNLPFWTSSKYFPYCYAPEEAEYDQIFWGNCTGSGRSERYGTIASLPGRTKTFGRMGEDPKGVHGGVVRDVNNAKGLVSKTFKRFKVGLSIPQRFADYAGSPYDYPALKDLGTFQVPSRVIQYAASGLPILSIGDELADIFPGVVSVPDRKEAARALVMLRDEERLLALSRRVHETFLTHYSAAARARFILSVLEHGPEAYGELDSAARATLFMAPEELLPPPSPRREEARSDPPPAPASGNGGAVVISGYYGRDNLGDELILQSLVRNIEGGTSGIAFTVAAENPEKVNNAYGLPAFSRRDLARADREAKASPALILGGGGLWHDYSFEDQGGVLGLFSDSPWSVTGYSKLPLLWKIHGKPFHVFGIGVGPLASPDAKDYLRFLSELAATVSVRDERSRQALLAIPGWKKEVNVFPDPVFALDLDAFRAHWKDEGCTIGVNLRQWPYHDLSGFVRNLSSALSAVAEKRPVRLVGLPLQPESDLKALEDLFEQLPASLEKEIAEDHSPQGVMTRLSQCTALLTMRLHSAILGWRLGVPTIGFSYDPKVDALYERLGIPGLALSPLRADADDIVSAFESVLNDGKHLAEAAKKNVQELEQGALRGLDYLKNQLLMATA